MSMTVAGGHWAALAQVHKQWDAVVVAGGGHRIVDAAEASVGYEVTGANDR